MFISLALTLSAATLALASPSPLQKRAGPQIVTKCTAANTIALTFDDGPYIYQREVVDQLDSFGAKGTFFHNGDNYDCIYDETIASNVKYAYDHGHQISSHTWAHKDLTTLTWDEIHDEMWRVEEAVMKITGAYPAFMRPPYGNYNDLVVSASFNRNQSVTLWDFDSGDSVGATVAQQKTSYDQLIGRHPSNVLSLEHEVYDSSVHQVLPYILPKLVAAGYKLVTVAECVGMSPYQWTGPPFTRDNTWHC